MRLSLSYFYVEQLTKNAADEVCATAVLVNTETISIEVAKTMNVF